LAERIFVFPIDQASKEDVSQKPRSDSSRSESTLGESEGEQSDSREAGQANDVSLGST
jgi:hypothetical protein